MKSNGKIVLTLMLSCLAGTGAFWITHHLKSEASASSSPYFLQKWLHLTNRQDALVRQADPSFEQDVAEQVRLLCQNQKNLAALFDDSQSDNEMILTQMKNVISTHHALIRRIGAHLLAIRQTLSTEQQKQLMLLCAEVVRGREGQRLLCQCDKTNCPCRCCREEKPGCGACPSSSSCPAAAQRCKGCRRGSFAQEVELTPDQEKQIQIIDPAFKEESARLTEEVKQAHAVLAQEMESMSTSDEQIFQKLEAMAEAHDRLEQRTIQHVLLIRSYLTPKQQKLLAGLCAN